MILWRPPASRFTFVAVFTALIAAQAGFAQTPTWTADTVATGISSPTSLAFGPDGRLYVLQLNGRLHIYTLGADRKPIATQVVSTLSTDPMGYSWACLGISFDPLDSPDSVRVYISRTRVYQPASVGAYLGRMTKLTGPSFSQPVDIISGFPVSRMDHANNGTFFGDDGNLYIQQGGNTNSGVPGSGLNGNREESLLSGATLIAYVRRPGFDGRITWSDPDPAVATQTSGFDVKVFAPGFRNPYDLVMHSNGFLYGTDNGPNSYFPNGTLWGCDSIGPSITTSDELVLIEKNHYYGHPNRPRSFTDPRQCFFRPPTDPSDAGYTAPLRVVTSSTNGILEYRSRRFGSVNRGDLYTARFEGGLGRATLSPDGRAVTGYLPGGPMYGALDVVEGPDGTLFGARYGTGQVLMQCPIDPPSLSGPKIVRMWPERGPHNQARTATIRGSRLALASAPQVQLGGVTLQVLSFDSSSVTVSIPSMGAPGWRSLTVTTAEGTDLATSAYRVIRPDVSSGDVTPPIVDIEEPERRYYDRFPPTLTIHAHDRLGLASVEMSVDGGAWQFLATSVPDTSAWLLETLSNTVWAAASPGEHEVRIRATDDAGLVTIEGRSWIKGLPAAGYVRINSGGPGVWSTDGLWFSPDSAVVSGTSVVTELPIAKTAEQSLFRDARASGPTQAAPDYQLQLPNRAYMVRLSFAEIDTAYACPGCRVFDVVAEGEKVIENLDLSIDPGAFHATERIVETLVMDGRLDLSFGPGVHASLVSAIEAYPLGLNDVTPPTVANIPEPQWFVYATPPNVTISAADPADGELASLQFSIDGGAWQSIQSRIGDPKRDFVWTMPGVVLQGLTPGMHALRIRAIDLAGQVAVSAAWNFGRDAVVGVDGPGLPVAGLRAWPNPARGAALRVAFSQPVAGQARLRLFDVAGRTVLERSLGWRPAGGSETMLDLESARVPAGLYFVRFDAPGVEHTTRVIRMP